MYDSVSLPRMRADSTERPGRLRCASVVGAILMFLERASG